MMRDALIADLMIIPDVNVSLTHDARLDPPNLCASRVVSAAEDVWNIWAEEIAKADAVFIIAPETDGVLLRLSLMVEQAGKKVLNSGEAALKVSASKCLTSARLYESAVNVVPSYALGCHDLQESAWVVKPDDGAGCTSTTYFADVSTFSDWYGSNSEFGNLIIQPFIEGIPASISMLCKGGQAWVLSCNRQLVSIDANQFVFHGVEINGMRDEWARFAEIAAQIARALPALAGYVGVDVIVQEDQITVIEINPRLTTSYVGLSQALSLNPARLLLDLFYNDEFVLPDTMTQHIVKVSV